MVLPCISEMRRFQMRFGGVSISVHLQNRDLAGWSFSVEARFDDREIIVELM